MNSSSLDCTPEVQKSIDILFTNLLEKRVCRGAIKKALYAYCINKFIDDLDESLKMCDVKKSIYDKMLIIMKLYLE